MMFASVPPSKDSLERNQMKPQLPPERFPPSSALSRDASTVLSILNELGIERGGSVPFKPLIFHWSRNGGRGGSDLVAAIDELAAAGHLEPVTEQTTMITRK